jgi:hypothetical protein
MRSDEREQLEMVAEQVLSTVDQGPKDQPREQYAWICSQCAEEIPDSFDIFWNCGTDKSGHAGPRVLEGALKTDPIVSPPPSQAEIVEIDAKLLCNLCGSTKVVPNVQIVDRENSGHHVVVYGSPGALFFKDVCWGEITADVCGECGHTQLRVRNFKELYDHYLTSLGGAVARP